MATSTSAVTLTGLGSGMDYTSIINQIITAESAPITQLQTQQSTVQQQQSAYTTVQTELTALQTTANALTPDLFNSRAASVGSAAIASASADSGTAVGTYTFNITKLASAAAQQGTTNVGAALNPTSDDVSTLTLGNAGFTTPVTAGNFTVNGQTVSVATTDTLQAVFDKISTATGGAVTGSYDHTTDTISLTSANPIQLGSATDSSNFLNAAQLYNNSTGPGADTITSTNPLGGVQLTNALSAANLATPLTDDGTGSGNGQFTINGVAISYNLTSDTVNSVIEKINNSTAGVTARYDASKDQFTLTDNNTGDVGFALQDNTGNFLAATGLLGGTLQRGSNLLYTVNGGGQLVSQSNTIDPSNSGVPGLHVTALTTGATSVQVSADTATIGNAITSFVNEYNKLQSVISTQTASSTDAQGNVTAGPLTGDTDMSEMASQLRTMIFSAGTPGSLSALGWDSNSKDDTLSQANTTAMNSVLSSSLSTVQDYFTNATTGLATQVDSYVTKTTGDNGFMTVRQGTLTKKSTNIANQITTMQTNLTNDQQKLQTEFNAMDAAEAQITQQSSFLTSQFGSASGSALSSATIS